ncbi:cysteine-rich venom protein 1-like [Diabrotica virgifera virgifera]|uniref:Cysteine-rich venom protein 1-like n=1 Tax=Diabrotica virgifera virgifera TaxID=50390 RepID=A0A6P7FBY4_DIAVI|nr:cysteine-rich venom protein 1-like [Diabrotica virgifera virgifera]
MKNLVVLIVLSCLSVIAFSAEKIPLCPANSSPGCKPCCPDPSCSNRRPICPLDRPCFDVRSSLCQSQCRCDPGYLKNSKGQCVLPCQCPRLPIREIID